MVWYWFPNCVINLVLLTQIRFLFLDNGAKPFLKFYIFWSYLLFFDHQFKWYIFLNSMLVKCGLIYNLIPLCLKKGRSWVGTNWLLVTTAELTGGLYMIWIMALWIIFELLLSAEYFLLYIFCSMAMELFGKVKVFWFEWILIYCTMGFE